VRLRTGVPASQHVLNWFGAPKLQTITMTIGDGFSGHEWQNWESKKAESGE